MKPLTNLEKRLDALAEWARPPNPQAEETRRFLAALTSAEIDRAGAILIDADDGVQPTEEDLAFLAELESREPVDLPPIDPRQPVCNICRGQPAWSRDGALPLCQGCHDADEL